jgi:hypothetical protein
MNLNNTPIQLPWVYFEPLSQSSVKSVAICRHKSHMNPILRALAAWPAAQKGLVSGQKFAFPADFACLLVNISGK